MSSGRTGKGTSYERILAGGDISALATVLETHLPSTLWRYMRVVFVSQGVCMQGLGEWTLSHNQECHGRVAELQSSDSRLASYICSSGSSRREKPRSWSSLPCSRVERGWQRLEQSHSPIISMPWLRSHSDGQCHGSWGASLDCFWDSTAVCHPFHRDFRWGRMEALGYSKSSVVSCHIH